MASSTKKKSKKRSKSDDDEGAAVTAAVDAKKRKEDESPAAAEGGVSPSDGKKKKKKKKKEKKEKKAEKKSSSSVKNDADADADADDADDAEVDAADADADEMDAEEGGDEVGAAAPKSSSDDCSHPSMLTYSDDGRDDENDDDDVADDGSEIPDTIDVDSANGLDVAEEEGKELTKKEKKEAKKKMKKEAAEKKKEGAATTIPFMDAFYQLSSEGSAIDRSIAARDLIRHCFPSPPAATPTNGDAPAVQACDVPDAAYALKRLLDGLCSGRAASRQGFASCLSSFLRVASSVPTGEGGEGDCAMGQIVRHGDNDAAVAASGDDTGAENGSRHLAELVREKLLAATEFHPQPPPCGKNVPRRKKLGGMEERDHSFGRLFGILAVARSGTLNAQGVPPSVAEGYSRDLVDLYQYKSWMREPATSALIELLSSLDVEGDSGDGGGSVVSGIVRNSILPGLFPLAGGEDDDDDDKVGATERETFLKRLNPEQIALAVHLQSPRYDAPLGRTGEKKKKKKNGAVGTSHPLLDGPILTADSVPALAEALASTSRVVHPRCHAAWDAIWTYLTEEEEATEEEGANDVAEASQKEEEVPAGSKKKKDKKKRRKNKTPVSDPKRRLRDFDGDGGAAASAVIEGIVRYVVVDRLLGCGSGEEEEKKAEENAPSSGLGSNGVTHERRALALRIVRTLVGAARIGGGGGILVLPSGLVGTSVLRPEIVERVFVNVMRASGGGGGKKKRKSIAGGAGGNEESVEHHLKPLATAALSDMVAAACSSVERRAALAHALLSVEPRFDSLTKTGTVADLLMLSGGDDDDNDHRDQLWRTHLRFLEERIASSLSADRAAAHVELLHHLAKADLSRLMPTKKKRPSADTSSSLAPANVARGAARFLFAGAFFDCAGLTELKTIAETPSKKKKKKKKKGKDTEAEETAIPPPRSEEGLLSGLRVRDILTESKTAGAAVPRDVRVVASARFFSILSEIVSGITAAGRGGEVGHGNSRAGKSEAAYRALTELCGVSSLLEAGGAARYGGGDSDDVDGNGDGNEGDVDRTAKESMLLVQSVADGALIGECGANGGSDNADALRAYATFATGCGALMNTLYLQLHGCGGPSEKADGSGDDNDDSSDDGNDESDRESLREFISDLADAVSSFRDIFEKKSVKRISDGDDDNENPMAAVAGLLVNVLSSPIGGAESGKKNESRASASRLTKETAKMAWNGVLALACALEKRGGAERLVDEDVMNILVGAVCGTSAMDEDAMDVEEESSDDDGSRSSDNENGVFVNANVADLDFDSPVKNSEGKEGGDSSVSNADDVEEDDDVELDPSQLENILMEDNDTDASVDGIFGQLEHHAGADAALAQLIKLKNEARKGARSERERVELSNRLRCASLLDALFSGLVFQSGLLPIEAVLGSIVPILRSRRLLGKAVAAASSSLVPQAKTHLSAKTVLLDRLSSLLKDKLSKFRCTNDKIDDEELVIKAVNTVYEEIKLSFNQEQCSCCSLGLIISLRCIRNAENCERVIEVYNGAAREWSSRKATKIHTCTFEDLIKRIPSLARVILVQPLIFSAGNAHSAFLKCESFRLLASLYGSTEGTETLDQKANHTLKEGFDGVAGLLITALSDPSLQEAKNTRKILDVTKHFVEYSKTHKYGGKALLPLQSVLKKIGENSLSDVVRKMCSLLSGMVSELEISDDKGNGDLAIPKSNKKKSKNKKKNKS